tara:strand:+ start:1564 stop:1755 length:192 start_codon:yes stop_codon:yes gene_type:complete
MNRRNTKLCKCGHNKTNHTARGGDRLMARATGQVISPCYAIDEIGERCGCLYFEEYSSLTRFS